MDINERIEKLRRFAAENLILSRRQLVSVFLLFLFIVTGSSLLYWQSRPKKVESVKTKKITRAKPVVEKLVKVHVAGAIKAPGVYDLKASSRVVDAIAAAGGQKEDADLDALNLAAKISDEQKIMVPVKATTATLSGNEVATSAAPGAEPGKVPLNSATTTQLQQLDGVGPVLAKRIISYRTTHRSFKTIAELQKVKGIGVKKYADLKDQVSLY